MQAQLEIKLQMARQFLQSGREDQAEALIMQVLALDPDNTGAGSALAMLYTRQQKHESAIEVLDRTFGKNPDNPEILLQLATVYKGWGKFDRAKACYRQAAQLDALRAPQILLALATACKFSEYDDDVRLMEDTYAGSGTGSPARSQLAFALGKVFNDLQDYEKAFGYFQEANRIVAAESNFSMEVTAQAFQAIKDIMDSGFFRRYENTGVSGHSPVFVTGLPRSGTTLVEQILASHPEVYGGGELEKISGLVTRINHSHTQGRLFPLGFDALDPGLYRENAERYLKELGALSGDRPRATDKSISNYIYIGLIRVMLPDARIVLCKRDPRDIGLSIFQLDLGYGYPWAYRLDWIGGFYGLFDDLMDHWNRCLPGRIHTLQYEDLVENPERHIRALLEYCDLEFDPACLDFYATDRIVTTSSRDQVRKPIYKGSVQRWKNYEAYLGPMISALGMD